MTQTAPQPPSTPVQAAPQQNAQPNLLVGRELYPVILISDETGTIRNIQAAWDGSNWLYQGKFNKIATVAPTDNLIFQDFETAKAALVQRVWDKTQKAQAAVDKWNKIYANVYHMTGPRNG